MGLGSQSSPTTRTGINKPMMKPLFLTYSTGKEPFLTLANKLREDIKTLYAGDFYHLVINGPGNNMDFFVEANGLLCPYISKALSEGKPVVVLDVDNGLVKSIDALFEADFDVAAVFRYPQMQETGRQDYCSGLVALNNKRPAVVKNFWVDWTYKTAFYKQGSTKLFPSTLAKYGWLESWFTDQGALNQILLPDGNKQDPDDDEYRIIPGTVYEAHGYKVLPLERRIYGALPGDSKDAYVIHYKGKLKNQRLG